MPLYALKSFSENLALSSVPIVLHICSSLLPKMSSEEDLNCGINYLSSNICFQNMEGSRQVSKSLCENFLHFVLSSSISNATSEAVCSKWIFDLIRTEDGELVSDSPLYDISAIFLSSFHPVFPQRNIFGKEEAKTIFIVFFSFGTFRFSLPTNWSTTARNLVHLWSSFLKVIPTLVGHLIFFQTKRIVVGQKPYSLFPKSVFCKYKCGNRGFSKLSWNLLDPIFDTCCKAELLLKVRNEDEFKQLFGQGYPKCHYSSRLRPTRINIYLQHATLSSYRQIGCP